MFHSKSLRADHYWSISLWNELMSCGNDQTAIISINMHFLATFSNWNFEWPCISSDWPGHSHPGRWIFHTVRLIWIAFTCVVGHPCHELVWWQMLELCEMSDCHPVLFCVCRWNTTRTRSTNLTKTKALTSTEWVCNAYWLISFKNSFNDNIILLTDLLTLCTHCWKDFC